MFDHLEKKFVRQRSGSGRIIRLAVITGLASIVLTGVSFFIPTGSGFPEPTAVRLSFDNPADQVQTIIGDQEDLLLVQMSINTPSVVQLDQLAFEIDGAVTNSNFENFKLFIDGSQVGYDVDMDAGGNLVFNLENVELSAGRREVALRADWRSTGAGASFVVRLHGKPQLSSADMPPDLKLVAPTVTALFFELPTGDLFAYTVPESNPNMVTLSAGDRLVAEAEFMIGSSAEVVDLSGLNITYTSPLDGWARAELWVDGRRQATFFNPTDLIVAFQSGEVVVSPKRPARVMVRTYFDEGSVISGVDLVVRSISGIGYSSQSQLLFDQPLALAVAVVPDDISLTSSPNKSELGYVATISSLSGQPIMLEQIPFRFETDSSVSGWRITVDAVPADVTVELKGDRGVIHFTTATEIASGSTVEIVPLRLASEQPGTMSLMVEVESIVWQPAGPSGKFFAWQKSSPNVLGAEYVEF